MLKTVVNLKFSVLLFRCSTNRSKRFCGPSHSNRISSMYLIHNRIWSVYTDDSSLNTWTNSHQPRYRLAYVGAHAVPIAVPWVWW
ncbi:hypothetical protein FKM82_026080 [Ascaphus truei]